MPAPIRSRTTPVTTSSTTAKKTPAKKPAASTTTKKTTSTAKSTTAAKPTTTKKPVKKAPAAAHGSTTPAIGRPARVRKSEAGAVSTAPRAVIGGVQEAIAHKATIVNNGGTAGSPTVVSSWGNQRGYIESRIEPKKGGWEIEVDVHHSQLGDKVTLQLFTKVNDRDQEHWILLAVPVSEAMRGTKKDDKGMHVTTKKFFVAIDDINAFFKKKAGTKRGGEPKLVFQPGDKIAIEANWGSGHRAGGRRDERQGYLTTPALPDSKVVSITTGRPVTGKTVVSSAAKPVELTVMVPSELVKQYPKIFSKEAKLVSRREDEGKLEAKLFSDQKQMTLKLLQIAAMPDRERQAELKKIFGESGWDMGIVDRYFQKDTKNNWIPYKKGERVWTVRDEAGEHKFDFEGLPKLAEMVDVYQDDNAYSVAQVDGAVRFRDGEIKAGEARGAMGKFQVKPGGGVLNPFTGVASRVENSLETRPAIGKDPAAMRELVSFATNGPAPYNPMKELQKVAYGVNATQVVGNNVLENTAHRTKFTFHHPSGLELELSCDLFTLTASRDNMTPPSTRSMSVDRKYAHWKAQFEANSQKFSTKAGVVNKGTFAELSPDKKRRIEVDVEVSVTTSGQHKVSEKMRIHGRQLEVEMEHVQANSSAPAQQGSMAAKSVGQGITTLQQEEALFKGLSDDPYLDRTPTVHYIEDIKNPDSYKDESYVRLNEVQAKLNKWAFPNGVNASRQKAAYGLEAMGLIPARTLPQLSVQAVGGYLYMYPQQRATGETAFALGKTQSLAGIKSFNVKMGDFPLDIDFKASAGAKGLMEALAAAVNKTMIYTARVVDEGVNVTMICKRV